LRNRAEFRLARKFLVHARDDRVKILENQSFARMRRRTRSPPRNAQLSRPRTPWSRLRAVVDYRPKLARTLADRGRRPAIRGFPL